MDLRKNESRKRENERKGEKKTLKMEMEAERKRKIERGRKSGTEREGVREKKNHSSSFLKGLRVRCFHPKQQSADHPLR